MIVTHILKNFVAGPFFLAFMVSFLLVPLVMKIAVSFGLVDDPRKRKHPAHVHTGIIPRAGGLAIFGGILLSLLLFVPIEKKLVGILLGSLTIVVIGVLDDKFDLNPYYRLLAGFMAAFLVVASGVGISYINNPFGELIRFDAIKYCFFIFGSGHCIVLWADLLALFWIVWCMSMVDWSGGVDGQLPGFVAISSFFLGILSLRFMTMGDFSQWMSTALAFAIFGAYAGFLPWNFFPQKIMPGYSGKALAGFLLGVLAILSVAKMGTAVLVLGVPMMDAIYVAIRRVWQGKMPVWGDRGHLHHRLMDVGWGKRRVALFYWLLSAILGVIAVLFDTRQKFFAIIGVSVVVGGIILWLTLLSVLSSRSDHDSG